MKSMRTIQEYLRQADRTRLLDALAYDDLCDIHLLLECRDMTIDQIQDACRKQMNNLIEHLLAINAEPSDHMVLYMVDTSSFNRDFSNDHRSLNLVDLNEIQKNIYASSYAFELTDWGKTLGYLVADNKLTQDYMIDLLTQYLREISFFGSDPQKHRERIEEVCADLERSVKEIAEGGHTIPAEEVLEELRKKHGWPVDEKDEFQDQLHSEIMEAEMRYGRYCDWRERSRILRGLGVTAPSFEEAEKQLMEVSSQIHSPKTKEV